LDDPSEEGIPSDARRDGRGSRNRDTYSLAIATGLRLAEIVGLNAEVAHGSAGTYVGPLEPALYPGSQRSERKEWTLFGRRLLRFQVEPRGNANLGHEPAWTSVGRES
jgi:hypothetical protein